MIMAYILPTSAKIYFRINKKIEICKKVQLE